MMRSCSLLGETASQLFNHAGLPSEIWWDLIPTFQLQTTFSSSWMPAMPDSKDLSGIPIG